VIEITKLEWDFMRKQPAATNRVFTGYGSVEVVDKDGDLIPVEAIRDSMAKYFDIGGPITDMHSNRKVGEMLGYKVTEKAGKPAIYFKGFIHDSFDYQNDVWKAMHNGTYEGLSIGAAKTEKEQVIFKDGQVFKVQPGVDVFEVAVVTKPANPGATLTAVAMAKSYNFFAKAENIEVGDSMLNKSEQEFIKNEMTKQDNPWAICTAAVGRADKTKFESCVQQVKEGFGIKAEHKEKSGEKITLTKNNGDSMTKEIKKQEEMPEEPEEEAALAEKVKALEEAVAKLMSIMETKAEELEEETSVGNEDKEDEEKVEKQDLEDESTEEAIIQEKEEIPDVEADSKPATPPADITKTVEKAVKKALAKQMKTLKKSGETPYPTMGFDDGKQSKTVNAQMNEYINKALDGKAPMNWNEFTNISKKAREQAHYDKLKELGILR